MAFRLWQNLAALRRHLSRAVQTTRFEASMEARYPGVHFAWPLSVRIDDLDALSLASGCSVGTGCEIVVLRSAAQSQVAGSLELGAGVHLGGGCNVRAAGGAIRVGPDTQIAQQVHLIASNHRIDPTTGRPAPDAWDAQRHGITIGRECWIGAGAIILPGVTIGDHAIVGAGSVVTKSIAPGESWRGNPARPPKPLAND